MRKTAQETAFLKRRDQPVDTGLGREIQGLLHLVEGRRDAAFLDPLMDEHEQFVLFTGEHRRTSKNKAQTLADVL